MTSAGMKHPRKHTLLSESSTYLRPTCGVPTEISSRILYLCSIQFGSKQFIGQRWVHPHVDGPLVQVAQLLCVRGAVQRQVCQ